jgi:hypothetical protein
MTIILWQQTSTRINVVDSRLNMFLRDFEFFIELEQKKLADIRIKQIKLF